MPTDGRSPTAEVVNDPRQMPLLKQCEPAEGTLAYYEREVARIASKRVMQATVTAMPETEKEQVGVSSGMKGVPECPESMRIIPSTLLRSALFGIMRRGSGRKYIDGETLTAWKGASIRYKGQQLDQYDLDVWLQVLYIVRQQSFNVARAEFTARSFLKTIGRKVSGAAVNILFKSLERMVACAVTVELNGRSYTGSLIENFVRDKQSDLYVVHINPDLCRLFDAGHTRLHWETRLALPTDLSRWLHGYVLSHQATLNAPHRIAVKTLYALTGSSAAALKSFRQILRQSMTSLEQANVVWKWRITEGDALEFVRPSSSRLV